MPQQLDASRASSSVLLARHGCARVRGCRAPGRVPARRRSARLRSHLLADPSGSALLTAEDSSTNDRAERGRDLNALLDALSVEPLPCRLVDIDAGHAYVTHSYKCITCNMACQVSRGHRGGTSPNDVHGGSWRRSPGGSAAFTGRTRRSPPHGGEWLHAWPSSWSGGTDCERCAVRSASPGSRT